MKKATLFVVICLITFFKAFGQKPVISYPPNNFTFTQGQEIKYLYPNNSGTQAISYTVSPLLPNGLNLDAHSGIISGTPSVATGTISYTIKATSAPGDTGIVSIQITINPGAPQFLYSAPGNLIVGTTIAPLKPSNTFGPADSYTINPALPSGLSLDKFGTISGTPLVATPAALYTVTATNVTGSSTYVLRFSVQPMSPHITYPPFATFIAGVCIPDLEKDPVKKANDETTLVYNHQRIIPLVLSPTPVATGSPSPINYSVSPALPAGLILNALTGDISGTPTTATPVAKYTVTASYTNDPPSTADIMIAVITNPDIVSTPATISFVGQGDIQQSLTTGSKIPASTGIGVVYRENSNIKYKWLHHIEIDFSVNVASTVDTIKSVNDPTTNMVTNKSAFGNSVLLPLNSGEAFSFRGLAYFTERGGPNGNYQRNAGAIPVGTVLSGLDIAVQGSNRNWEYDSNDKSVTLIQASQLSVYTGIFHEFITPTAANSYGQNASVTIGIGYSGRFIMGDVAQTSNSALRQSLLGTTQTSFNGYEVKLGLRFYNIQAEVHLPFLSGKSSVPGLSGAQPYTFIGFTGGFPIDLTSKSN
ncbi:Ig domain-containing protein [Mucilaginibacter sp. E4BP6]|uniref:Ig domain-containing protein n=1 Tax=Mucilaginibacter sp. E4BP6 TaxID=2723089 RepID=UPI0015C7FEF9|nr:Ig domain-containing protein [Mucilaginibacter sp. E4BP6]NYE68228.1 hypothetical protein [Mucilaginibacter sp. E4BP6]